MVKISKYSQRNCLLCLTKSLLKWTYIFNIYNLEEHDESEGKHKIILSKPKIFVWLFVVCLGTYSTISSLLKITYGNLSEIYFKIELLHFLTGLYVTVVALFFGMKVRKFLTFKERVSCFMEYGATVKIVTFKEDDKKKLLRIANVSKLVLNGTFVIVTSAAILESYYFGLKFFCGRFMMTLITYTSMVYLVFSGIVVESTRIPILNNVEYLKKLLERYTQYEMIQVDLKILSRMVHAISNDYSKGFDFGVPILPFLSAILLILNINFFSLTLDVFWFRKELDSWALREFHLFGFCVSEVGTSTFFVVWYIGNFLKELDDLPSALHKQRTTKFNAEESLQMEIYLKTYDMKRPFQTVLNLFTVDKPLLASVLASTLTYVLVIMQFELR